MHKIIDGEIDINKVNVNQNYTKEVFLSSSLYSKVVREDNKTIYSTYDIGLQKIGDELFYVSLCFRKSDLYILTFCLQIENERPIWANWSAKNEMLRKELHDKWLYKQLGHPPYKYVWGDVLSEFDPRSGSSYITITYL